MTNGGKQLRPSPPTDLRFLLEALAGVQRDSRGNEVLWHLSIFDLPETRELGFSRQLEEDSHRPGREFSRQCPP